MRRRAAGTVLLAWLLAGPAGAVQPDEILSDPGLEQRARAISGGLRCLVCQNQSIDDSDAPLARDLRLLVRERLRAGDDDGTVRSFLVERYGDFILLRPPVSAGTLLLWGGPLLMIGGAAAGLVLAARRRDRRPDPLSADDRAALDRLLQEDHATASNSTGFAAPSNASMASAGTGREIR